MPDQNIIEIAEGYRPGLLGRITEMHAAFYARFAGFDQVFEAQVAAGLAEFVGRIAHPANGAWVALLNERIVGSVIIDGEDLGSGVAHLRWFIVDDSVRGHGVGQKLLARAVRFCDDREFSAVHLWTFEGLSAARALYDASGFKKVEERLGSQWGKEVVEQRFERTRGESS
jgi:GNAT superfamily N-acetyltransferase